MATVEELKLQIKAEVADAVGKLKTYERQTKATADQNKSLSQSFSAMRDVMQGPIAAGKMVAGILGDVAKVGGELYDAFAEAERAGIVFNQAIKDGGNISSEGGRRLEQFAKELQRTTIYEDDATVAIMGNLAAMGKSEDQIKELITAATNYASATGIDLDSAVKQLNSTLQGNVGVLGRQNAAIKSLTPEQLKNGEAIDIIAKQYQGMAEAVGGSAGGGKISLTNAFGDLKEEIGALVAERIKPASSALTEFFRIVAGGMADARNLQDALKGGKNADIEAAISLQRKVIANMKEEIAYSDGLIGSKEEDLTVEQNRLKALQARQRVAQELAGKERAAASTTAETAKAAEDAAAATAEWNEAWNPAVWAEVNKIAETALGNIEKIPEVLYNSAEAEQAFYDAQAEASKAAVEGADEQVLAQQRLSFEINETTEAQKAQADAALSGYQAMSEALGASLITGEDGWKAFGKAGLNAIAGVVEAMAMESDIIIAKAIAQILLGDFTKVPGLGSAIGASVAAHSAAGAIRAIPLAEGGVVMPSPGGTIARIGEAGSPEAVIPLDRMGGMGGGVTQIFNIGGSVIAERQVKSLAMSGMAQAARGY